MESSILVTYWVAIYTTTKNKKNKRVVVKLLSVENNTIPGGGVYFIFKKAELLCNLSKFLVLLGHCQVLGSYLNPTSNTL